MMFVVSIYWIIHYNIDDIFEPKSGIQYDINSNVINITIEHDRIVDFQLGTRNQQVAQLCWNNNWPNNCRRLNVLFGNDINLGQYSMSNVNILLKNVDEMVKWYVVHVDIFLLYIIKS